MSPALTPEEFLRLSEVKPPLEYGSGGVITQRLYHTTEHAALQSDLTGRIDQYAAQRRLGRAYLQLRVNIGGLSRVLDVAFYSAARPPGKPYPTTPLLPGLRLSLDEVFSALD